MTKEEVVGILSDVCESDLADADMDMNLMEMGLLDSLAAVSFIVALEEKFGIRLSPTEFQLIEIASINKAYAFLQSKGL